MALGAGGERLPRAGAVLVNVELVALDERAIYGVRGVDAQSSAELVEVTQLLVLGFDGVRTVVVNAEALEVEAGEGCDAILRGHGLGFHAAGV